MTAYHSKRGPVEGCPQEDEPIRERAWTEGQIADMHREAFESWWNASKYMQVVFSKDSTKQVAWDGWLAAYASILSSVRDEWLGEVECCDAKGMWLVLSDDCPLVPGQHVIISAPNKAETAAMRCRDNKPSDEYM